MSDGERLSPRHIRHTPYDAMLAFMRAHIFMSARHISLMLSIYIHYADYAPPYAAMRAPRYARVIFLFHAMLLLPMPFVFRFVFIIAIFRFFALFAVLHFTFLLYMLAKLPKLKDIFMPMPFYMFLLRYARADVIAVVLFLFAARHKEMSLRAMSAHRRRHYAIIRARARCFLLLRGAGAKRLFERHAMLLLAMLPFSLLFCCARPPGASESGALHYAMPRESAAQTIMPYAKILYLFVIMRRASSARAQKHCFLPRVRRNFSY